MAIGTIINKHVNAIVHTRDDMVLQIMMAEKECEWVPFTNEDMFALMEFWWSSLTPEMRRHYYDKMLLSERGRGNA